MKDLLEKEQLKIQKKRELLVKQIILWEEKGERNGLIIERYSIMDKPA